MTAAGGRGGPVGTTLDALLDPALGDPPVADAPPERRGLAREDVRMLVARSPDDLRHRRARSLPAVLRPGDLLVLNTSDTLPAGLDGVTGSGERVRVHLSTPDPAAGLTPAEALDRRRSWWVVELRAPVPVRPGGPAVASAPVRADRAGTLVRLAGATLRVDAAYPRPRVADSRLWTAELVTPEPLLGWLATHGGPIRYPYVSAPWPLSAYRTPYADTPGSAEMPSAGRALTGAVLRRLRARGVRLADLVLHCGVSSPEAHEPPFAEWYSVPESTAQAVAEARRDGRRVVAVGTTVVRALETTGGAAGSGWTDLVVTPERGVSTVDGVLTGWHEPRGSHLHLLRALAGADLLAASYRAALRERYLWHEFGDLHLLLPD